MSLSSSQEDEEPRRGSRNRKQVDRFAPSHGNIRVEEEGNGEDSDMSSEDEQPNKRRRNAAAASRRKPRQPKVPKVARKVAVVVASDAAAADVDVNGFKTDSPLFNALLSPDIALQPLVDDWVHAYQGSVGDEKSEKAAVHEMVLFFIRACGLTADVDEDEVMDIDGVVDTVERIQDESVNTNAATYPLISRAKALRPFKTNLGTIISHLISTLHLTPHLFDDAENTKHSLALVPLILTWLHSMASSPLRPIRHTATYITLKINSALCDSAATASNELSIKQRQREAEVKKTGSGAAAQRRLKEAEIRVSEAHTRKTRLEEYMQEIFDVLFVHRVRDADPAIRTDCLHELGVWVKKYSEKYVSTSFLNYFSRGCNDPDGGARLETVKALAALFVNIAAVSNAASFTLRLAPRLIQMAVLDVETNVRVQAINTISLIDKTGALRDEDEKEREKVAKLIFDGDNKVRKAAAGFVAGLWEEQAEELRSRFTSLRAQKKKRAVGVSDVDMQRRLGWKALASLLVETSKLLDQSSADPSSSKQLAIITSEMSSVVTRASAAAEVLWSQIEILRDWLALGDYLLLDHSSADTDMWLLNEEEENFMLQMLIAAIKKEQNDDEDGKTKALMKILPRLFTKHQSEITRVAGLLSVLEHMNLPLYLDMRMTAAYESLWDDVTKQFIQHKEAVVLSAAIHAITRLTTNSPMAEVNTRKIADLEEALFSSLRDAIDGQDVDTMVLEEDALVALEAVLFRISLLARSRDIVEALEDEEGGQSSGWTIVLAFAGRGGLGYKEEAALVEHALQIIFLHVTWLFKRFTEDNATDEVRIMALVKRRNESLDLFERFSVRDLTNATEGVRRQSFIGYVNMHVLFSSRPEKPHPAARVCALEMAMDKQHKLGGAFQAAVERYESDRDDGGVEESQENVSIESAQREYHFLQLVSVFVGAIRCGVIDVEQAKEALVHYGSFGLTYDAIVKKLVDVLRDEGIYNSDPTTVQHVVGDALQRSFSAFLDTDDDDPIATISLARLASTAFVVHGTHFTVLKQIRPSEICDLHLNAVTWLFGDIAKWVRQEKASKNKDARSRLAAKRAQALTFFRPLAILLGPVTGRDALRIRTHLEEAIEASGVPIASTRMWDAYRAYEKKLILTASRDPELKLQLSKTATITAISGAATRSSDGLKSISSRKSKEIIEDDEDDVDMESMAGHSDSIDPVDDEEEEPVDDVDGLDASDEEDVGPAGNGTNKRPLPVNSDDEEEEIVDNNTSPEFTVSQLAPLDMDLEIDRAFSELPSATQDARDRSLSIEPVPKRRKTVKKY